MNVQIACPRCGKHQTLALADISAGKATACEGCGELIRFKGANTVAVQQAIDELQTKLGGTAMVNVRVKVKQRRPWWKFWGA
jgi:DNA-directed RNA polymerase subunit RPC12/RpoP